MKKLPGEIEKESFSIIREELKAKGIALPEENEAVILRCIHASADFDYAENLRFTSGAVSRAVTALRLGSAVVTDTNMALAGVSKTGLKKLGGEACCFMAEERIAAAAKTAGTTRAAAAMDYAAARYPGAVYAIGNAPTALLRIAEKIEAGLRPALVIGVPVGFVNVEESKEQALEICTRYGIPAILAMGRKGGSSIASAVCNALIYTAAEMLDPAERNGNCGASREQEKHYRFFQNRTCEYFPCHKGIPEGEFNCLFCYCPLYPLGENCGGACEYTEAGVKSCLNCSFPHRKENYSALLSRFPELSALAGKQEDGHAL